MYLIHITYSLLATIILQEGSFNHKFTSSNFKIVSSSSLSIESPQIKKHLPSCGKCFFTDMIHKITIINLAPRNNNQLELVLPWIFLKLVYLFLRFGK